MCINSTSVIRCICGNASSSSQCAFHNCQDVMQSHDTQVCRSTSTTGNKGNGSLAKTPEHIALCHKTRTTFRFWPQKPLTPPTNQGEGIDYLKCLMVKLANFARFLEFYSMICTR